MKLSDAWDFRSLCDKRRDLKEALASAQKESGGLGVTITGRYQDDEMIASARGAVVAELQRRIDAVEANLTAMGIEIDE